MNLRPSLSHRVFSLLLGVLSLGLMPGCGGSNGPRRVDVSGIVTLDDKNIPAGTIRFLPNNGNMGPATSGLIQSGKFRLTGESGPTPGDYRVLLTRSLDTGIGKLSGTTNSPQQLRLEWMVVVNIPDQDTFEQNFKLSTNDPPVP